MAGWDRGVARRVGALAPAVLVAGCVLLDAWYGDGWFLDGPWPLLGALVGGYLLGAWLPTWGCTVTVAGLVVALTAANQRHDPGGYPVADDLVFFLLVTGAPALAGAVLSRRRAQTADLARLGRRLEEQREADLEAAALEERQRIEVAVHRRLIEQIGALVLLAEGARRYPSPTAVADAVVSIEDGARATLVELREAVGTLRTGPEPVPEDRAGPPGESGPAPPSPGIADLALAAGIGAAIAVETLLRDSTHGPAWANVLAALVVAAPLAWRRTRPLPVLVATGVLGAAMTATLTPLPLTVTALALLLVTTYAAGAHARHWPLALVLSWTVTAGLAMAVPAAVRDADGLLPTLVLTTLVLVAGVVVAGASRREARLRAAVAELERGREIERRAAVATTRLELARGLHDCVAQAMTITCLQASAARGVGADPDAALAIVLDAARDCMAELRAGLDALDGPAPALDVRVLRRLADHAGLDVEWRLELPVGAGAPVALTLRVLREALTNVTRHAPASRVRVVVVDTGDGIEIEVVDDGTDHAGFDLGTGSGLAGLREALARRGGTLTAGPLPDGGFRLAASLPHHLQEVPA